MDTDVLLIGGGIMSATLAAMLAELEPDWRVVVVERAAELATESSNPWNNAGTGHSGYCELNYMPDPSDCSKAATIAEQFRISRQFWEHLGLDPSRYLHSTPHMSVVFGAHDVDYLRRRFETMKADPLFAGLEYSEDHAQIRAWAPLVMEGRAPDDIVAATRHLDGTDVDFGALTRELFRTAGATVLVGHEVLSLVQGSAWTARGRRSDGSDFEVRARRVFVGGGGNALKLLQRANLPEVRGYGVLPVGAGFLRCSDPSVVARHDAKVYGQAAIGAPPMSVPHLDKRVVDGTEHLMFGPYATFSTKLLKAGRLTDFFATVRRNNVRVLAGAARRNTPIIRFLVKELLARRRTKFAQLQRFYPNADPTQWEFIHAGQRAQLVTPGVDGVGELQQGTELVVSEDRSIAGVLGASPGASTAVPIMLDLLRRWSPDLQLDTWSTIFPRP